MKKSIRRTKLILERDTVKLLAATRLTEIAGGAPARTRDLPCIELTARDCD